MALAIEIPLLFQQQSRVRAYRTSVGVIPTFCLPILPHIALTRLNPHRVLCSALVKVVPFAIDRRILYPALID